MYQYTSLTPADAFRAWTEVNKNVSESILRAQRGALASFGVVDDIEVDDTEGTAYARPEWTFERSVEQPDDITVGDTVEFTKSIDDDDITAFASATGDTNKLHLQDEFAEKTRFEGRIVHGTLASGLISAALARLPGLTIYLSQDLSFDAPVRIGEALTAKVEVMEELGDRRFRLSTDVVETGTDEEIITGEAVVLIDDLPEVGSAADDLDE